jgi:hypothetical protein
MTAGENERNKSGVLDGAFVWPSLVRRKVRRRRFQALRAGSIPIHFRLAAGSWTGMCGEALTTRVLPSE